LVKLANLSKTKIQYSLEVFFLGIFVFGNKDFESGTIRKNFFSETLKKLGVNSHPRNIHKILIRENIINYKITFFLALSDVFAVVKMLKKKFGFILSRLILKKAGKS